MKQSLDFLSFLLNGIWLTILVFLSFGYFRRFALVYWLS
jgi:hypothetical protein